MKLHYKITSYSSEDKTFPITNLVSGGGPWESVRFCEYPQQITIQFFEPVNISEIHIASHASKIAERVHILFCLPEQSNSFQKYGYLEFENNEDPEFKYRELKKIQKINENTLYMRLLVWKNHQNTMNFFNQVGLSQITIFGNPITMNSLYSITPLKKSSFGSTMKTKDILESKIQILSQFKDEFVKNDDFENAKKTQEILKFVKSQSEKIKDLEIQKENAVNDENFSKAKEIKAEIDEIRNDVMLIADNFYDVEKKEIKTISNDSRIKERFEQLMESANFSQNDSRISKTSRASNKTKIRKSSIVEEEEEVVSGDEKIPGEGKNTLKNEIEEEEEEYELSQSKLSVSYDDRIVPAILKKNKKERKSVEKGDDDLNESAADNEFMDKKEGEEIVPEEMTQATEASASILFEFYDREVVKKLHSKYWNFKVEALNTIVEDSKQNLEKTEEIEKNRIKAIVYIFNRSIKEANFQVSSLSLDLLIQLISSKKALPKNIQAELHNELEKSINEIFLKMGDNQRIKQKCSECLIKMMSTELYGIPFIYQSISKSYSNQNLTHNIKIKKFKISAIQNMTIQAEMGAKNGLPFSSIEFVCKAAEESNDEIRKEATMILKMMKQRGAKDRVIEAVRSRPGLKGSIIKELES